MVVAILFGIIGLLHLNFHYRLLLPQLATTVGALGTINLQGMPAGIWDMYQGFSFMMGVCFIIISLLNVAFLRAIPEQFPPLGLLLMMMLLLAAVVYAGIHFFFVFQVYGGLLGLVLLSIASALHLRKP